MQVGHLYVSKLTQRKNDVEHAIHMQVNPLAWTSKEDIEDEFRKSLAEIDSPQTWSNVRSMIPWTINNCVSFHLLLIINRQQLISGHLLVN
jgi:hypothetical protein